MHWNRVSVSTNFWGKCLALKLINAPPVKPSYYLLCFCGKDSCLWIRVHIMYSNIAKQRNGWGSRKAGLEKHGHLDSLWLIYEGFTTVNTDPSTCSGRQFIHGENHMPFGKFITYKNLGIDWKNSNLIKDKMLKPTNTTLPRTPVKNRQTQL